MFYFNNITCYCDINFTLCTLCNVGNLLCMIEAFHGQQEDIHLETCCITGRFNTCMYLLRALALYLCLSSIVFYPFPFKEMNDTVVDGIHRPSIYGIGRRWVFCTSYCNVDNLCLYMTHCVWSISLCRRKCQNRRFVPFNVYLQRPRWGAAINQDFHWRRGNGWCHPSLSEPQYFIVMCIVS